MIVLEKRFGDVYSILSHAIEVAVVTNEKVQFNFNGVDVVVDKRSTKSNLSCERILCAVKTCKTILYL